MSIPKEQKAKIIRAFLTTPEKRAKLALSLHAPLDVRIGILSLWRKILTDVGVPFCEPLVGEALIGVNPEDVAHTEQSLETGASLISAKLNMDLVAQMEQLEHKVLPHLFHPREWIEDFRESLREEGILLMNARTYANFRMFARDDLEVEVQTELLRTGYMGRIENTKLYVFRHVGAAEMYHIPEGSGRYAETFEVTSIEPSEETADWKPSFQAKTKLCLEIYPDRISAFHIERE